MPFDQDNSVFSTEEMISGLGVANLPMNSLYNTTHDKEEEWRLPSFKPLLSLMSDNTAHEAIYVILTWKPRVLRQGGFLPHTGCERGGWHHQSIFKAQ